jgi:hypothetical protein
MLSQLALFALSLTLQTTVSASALLLPRNTPVATWANLNGSLLNYHPIYYADGGLYINAAPAGASTVFRLRCNLAKPRGSMSLSEVTCRDEDNTATGDAAADRLYTLFVDAPLTGGNPDQLRPVSLAQNASAVMRRAADVPVQRVIYPFGLVEGNHLFYYDAASLSLLYNWVAAPASGVLSGSASEPLMIWWADVAKASTSSRALGVPVDIIFSDVIPFSR